MSNSPLFKRAFVRGLNSELIRQGTIVYPSKEAADASADFVADQSAMPDPYTQGEVLDIKIATVAVRLPYQSRGVSVRAGGRSLQPECDQDRASNYAG